MTTAKLDGGEPGALIYEIAHHLKYTLAKDLYTATDHDYFLAVCYAVRDRAVERWIETQQSYKTGNVKRVCYLSQEYLLGRALLNNAVNLRADDAVRDALRKQGHELSDILETEIDAGLGNGGLGRLAACFLDSLATQSYPAIGYGLRYEYGIFRQKIKDGAQVEEPDNWLRLGSPWEFARPERSFTVRFGGRVVADPGEDLRFLWVDTQKVLGVPYDVPVVGWGSENVNTLRLWSARSADEFDLTDFSQGDYSAAVEHKVQAETLTKVLYPDDRSDAGRELRFRQEYFLVSCTLQDLLGRHKRLGNRVDALPSKIAIQLNDTHPSLAVAELMRLLVDEERVPWEKAWELTRATMAYTNHTLMAEALETWPVDLFARLLPRHLQIIHEINRRFLDEVESRWPGDGERRQRMSLIDSAHGRVRMAHLATVGSHSVNGVSRIHSDLVKTQLLSDFHELRPACFNNKTNGITPRRWLRVCNPGLSGLITDFLGHERWVSDLELLRELEPAADVPSVRKRFLEIKKGAKEALAKRVQQQLGVDLETGSLFDVQVKRLHEYKRQLLNLLHVVHLYLELRDGNARDFVPRTVVFGAKAAPAYAMAKRIIRLIHAVSRVIDNDPRAAGKLRVVFLPDYRVSLAELLVPAADLSEQISTAGTEASGTSNMKLALNGALTIGTLDGANIEILEAVGAENMFPFGLTTPEVAALRATTRNPGWEAYEKDASVKRVVDFVFSEEVVGGFEEIRQAILVRPDPWMVLADLPAYIDAQTRASEVFRDEDAWAKKALLNVARMGGFSSDRTIREYAQEIWNLEPHPIDMSRKASRTMLQFRKR